MRFYLHLNYLCVIFVYDFLDFFHKSLNSLNKFSRRFSRFRNFKCVQNHICIKLFQMHLVHIIIAADIIFTLYM